jgi:hypothetical protein
VHEKILERADAELAAGRAWRAREILGGAVGFTGGSAEILERYGLVLLQLGDLLEAGKFLFLSGRRGPDLEPAINLFLQRHGRASVAHLIAQFPAGVRRLGFDALPEAVRSELLARGAKPWPPRPARPRGARVASRWSAAAGWGCMVLIVLMLICAVVGALSIVKWMMD